LTQILAFPKTLEINQFLEFQVISQNSRKRANFKNSNDKILNFHEENRFLKSHEFFWILVIF